MDVVVPEFAPVAGPICPREVALARLQALTVVAHILGTIWPGLLPMAMLLVIPPIALVPGPTRMGVGALAMGLVVVPVAIVDIAIRVLKTAYPLRLVVMPLAFVAAPSGHTYVARAIRPHLQAVAMPLVANPLPCVPGAVRICVQWAFL
eukprot:CAMPEP_0115105718 /NCGR_PEP_ID=MMETSP0227-20121206/36176_1 /TAXON_ID=89957 /ORGANISM="Polarella glacialis, Strain CCMP 1383" /LENGTH=148 /DNA_ID=CAMNT_0002503077 /DNA_START=402 /DNA_END=846 /DNA_ORIENTATION=+